MEHLPATHERVIYWQQLSAFPNTAKIDAKTMCIHSGSRGAVRIAKLFAERVRR